MIGPATLESFDRCRRLESWLEEWRPNKVTPLGAVYAALRQTLTVTPYPDPKLAKEHVMQLAGERGWQTDRPDPYDQAVHYSYMAEVLARAIRQPSQVEGLNPHPAVQVGTTGLEWQPEAYLVGGGTRLMRVVLVDHWDDDRLMAELHGWRTIGDVCVTKLPMTIRVLVIGQSRGGRRTGHWTRARQHPRSKQLRFARRHERADGFAESWTTVWREDSGVGVDAWVEQMARDGVLIESAFEKRVTVPGPYACGQVLEDIRRIGDEIQLTQTEPKLQFPMNRSACDSVIHGPCRFQCVCLAPSEITPGETGLFTRRELTQISVK